VSSDENFLQSRMEEAIEKRLNKSLVDLAGDAMETMYELMNFAQKPNPKS
jgi:hypothetical protein